MAFQKLFDNPLWGDHCPLVLRWHDDQLKPLVDRLSPWMPDSLSDQMQYAVASVAGSIVTEKMITGRGVHYARAKDPYHQPKRGAVLCHIRARNPRPDESATRTAPLAPNRRHAPPRCRGLRPAADGKPEPLTGRKK